MSTVILFYVLVPQVSACHCSDCHCKENSNSNPTTKTATVEESANSSCCSQNQNQKDSETSVSIADVLTNTNTKSCCARMPVGSVSHDLNNLNQEQESPVCPCSLKQAPDQPNFILP
ncbi:MAG: hypothetical protein LBC02_02630, partial [Planctomycetaceae bacterium]|nr:hypothetical protein [Planctomycetaceae bacterium]